jgi:hypothetical protein
MLDIPRNFFTALRKCAKRTKKIKKVRQNPKKAKKSVLTHFRYKIGLYV